MAGLQMRLLDRADVRVCLASVDPVGVVEQVLRRHAEGRTELPAEGYLGWQNRDGASCRSLAMLGGLTGGLSGTAEPVLGIKVINAAVSNPRRGLERAGGIGMVFDPLTARPLMLAEVALISAVRTAAYTVLSVRHIGPQRWSRLGLLGTGTQARTHLDLLAADNPGLTQVRVHDIDPSRAAAFAALAEARHPAVRVGVCDTPRAVTADSEVVVTVTTSEEPYLEPEDLRPGSLVAHVSLDDVGPRVFATAEAVYVDDVGLVRENSRRILGALMTDGRIVPPSAAAEPFARPLTGTLGEVLLDPTRARRPTSGVVVSNPFGMSVLDVGLLHAVRRQAERTGCGRSFTFLPEDLPDHLEAP
jgi:ornithine cyclodeaminase